MCTMRMFDQSQRQSTGAITLLVLMMLVVFVLIMSAILQFVASQSRDATDREQREFAFYMSESGARYVQWLLSANGPTKSPVELVAPGTPLASVAGLPPLTTTATALYNQVVRDGAGDHIGEAFTDIYELDGPLLQTRSVAYPGRRPASCRAYEVDMQRWLDNTHVITRMEERPATICPGAAGNGCAVWPLGVQGRQATEYITSQLTETDCAESIGAGGAVPRDYYSWRAEFGDAVYIQVSSDDFQPRITVVMPSGAVESSSTCSGEVQTACLRGRSFSVPAPQDGLYQLYVESGDGLVGEYALQFISEDELPQ